MTRPVSSHISSASGAAMRLRVAVSYSERSSKSSLSYHTTFAASVRLEASLTSSVKSANSSRARATPCGAAEANTPVPASAIPSKNLRRLPLRALHASHIRSSFCLTPMSRRGSIAAVPHSKHVAVHIPQATATHCNTRDDRSISRSEARMRMPRRQELKNSACGITGRLL